MSEPDFNFSTLAQYEQASAESPEPLEYLGGRIVAQAVPSGNHERIKLNLILRFAAAVKRAECELFFGGVKVVCPNIDRAIPDLGVTCDPRDRRALDRVGEAQIEHPWLLVEVLSPSTQGEDRIGKLDSYREILSLTHYLLIDSRKRWMLLHERGMDGLFTIMGPMKQLTLPTIGEITSDLVYDATTVSEVRSE